MKLKKHNSNKNRRSFGIILFFLTIISFLMIGLRFSWIMVRGEVDGENLDQNLYHLYSAQNMVQAERGAIYDRNQNPLATSAKSYDLIAILTDAWSPESKPIHVQNPEAIAEVLSKHLAITKEQALDTLHTDASQVEFGNIGKNLSYDTVSNIQKDLDEKDLTGLEFRENQTRLYPNGIFASHTIGLAQNNSSDEEGNDPQSLEGVMGIEDYFDQELTGRNGSIRYQKDRFGYALPGTAAETVESEDGDDVHLTLDKRLQTHMENIVTEVNEEYRPQSLTATVVDAKTGEIIATTQRPTFNATTKEGIDQTWQNLLVEYTYEPGSTFKLITLAAAIEEGVFNPEATFMSGRREIAGSVVHDVDPEGWGEITYLEGVYRSSNVAFVNLVEKMGVDTWKNYIERFGFETSTGISLPNEASGTNPFDTLIQQYNTSFGQGLTVTPVQMIQAFTAISNDGNMMQPKIATAVSDSDSQEVTEVEPIQKPAPISQDTAHKVLSILKGGVESEIGAARGYQIEDQSIAAKTGTAQLVNPDTGEYYANHPNFIYSVVAMAPAENPKALVYITVQQPELTENAHSGHEVVQEIYHPLMNRVGDFVGISSHSESQTEGIREDEMPKLTNLTPQEAEEKMNQLGYDLTIVGNGSSVVQQYPQEGTLINDFSRVIVLTDGAMSMPDLTGWSRSDVLKLGELTGIQFNFSGEGYVIDQSRGANSFVEPGTEVNITLDSSQEILSEDETENATAPDTSDEGTGEPIQ